MKKQLSFLGALLVSSAVTASTTACNSLTVVAKDLKDVLTKIDLGVVSEKRPGRLPTAGELKKKLNYFNLNLEIKGIDIVDIDKDSAVVVGDGIIYKNNQIKITYQIATIDIRTRIIEGSYIGHFATSGQQPTIEAVSDRIHEYYDLEISHLIIENITNETAVIKGDNILYTHQVTVKFSTNDSVDLSVIIDKDLTVKTNGKDMPSNDDIMTALHVTYQEKLNTAVIAIEIIGATNAIISSTNQKIYTGKVSVNLNLDIRIALQDVINKGLDKIAIRSKIMTDADVIQALTKRYPMLKMNEIKVTLHDNNNVVITSLNENVYTGPNVIINNLLIDLSSVLVNKLPTFEIPGKNQPSQGQIMEALKTNNINLDTTKITVDKITDSSAIIIGDGKFYSKDAIVVTYNCDKAELLSNVLKNQDLGPITTNGLDTPDKEQIMQALKTKNTNLDVTKITVDKITDSSSNINGDNITYKGMVTVNFSVNDKTIIKDLSYNHSENNSVGSSNSTWTSPDITLLSNWKDYAPDWDSFTNKFTELSFGDESYFHVYCNIYTDQKLSGSELTIATNKIISDRNKNILQLNYYYDGGFWGAFLQLDGYIHIWHDEENIYLSINWSIDTIKCFRDRLWDINLQGVIFS